MIGRARLHPDELPVADWLNTRVNQPPPDASWTGETALLESNEFVFPLDMAGVLADLLDLYAEKSDADHDLNPEAANAAYRLKEKILRAAGLG